MKRTIRVTLFALLGAAAAAPLLAHADEDAALAKLRAYVAPIQQQALAALDAELATAKAALPAIVARDLVAPAVEHGVGNAVPVDADGQRAIEMEVDRLVVGAKATNARFGAYGSILEALLSKKGATPANLGKLIDRIDAAVKRVSAFDAKTALASLEARAIRRASALARGRLGSGLTQALSPLLTKLDARAESFYAKLDALPGLRSALSGFAGAKLSEAESTLRDEALKLARARVEAEVPALVKKLFAAALGQGSTEPRYKTIETGLRSMLTTARDRATLVKRQYESIAAQLAQMKLLTQPAKLVAKVKAAEHAQLAKAILSEAKSDPSVAKKKEVVALVKAEAAVRTAEASVAKAKQQATVAAVVACSGQGPGCVSAKIAVATKTAERHLEAARSKLVVATKVVQKIELKTESAKAFAPPSLPTAPTVSELNAKPAVVAAADKPLLAKAEKEARKEIEHAIALPAKLAPPKTPTQVVAALGKDGATVKVVQPKKHGSTTPPTVEAKPGSGAKGIRAALAAIAGLAKQDWKRTILALRLTLLRARREAPRALGTVRRALALAVNGAQLMYLGAARSRLLQQKRLFGRIPRGVERKVNLTLARPPTYLAGFNARARGASGTALDVARAAMIKLAISGQRLALASRILVGRARWRDARRAMNLYFQGLKKAKRGLRIAAQSINAALTKRATKKPAPNRRASKRRVSMR